MLSIVQGKSKKQFFIALAEPFHCKVVGEFSIKFTLSMLVSGKNPFIIS